METAAMTMATAARRLAMGGSLLRWACSKRPLSTTASSYRDDPSRYVTGVKASDLESDPVLAAYFDANFSDILDDEARSEIIADEPESFIPESKALSELNIRPLSCYRRDSVDEEGSRRCRRMRRLDMFVPGLLYGGDPNHSIIGNEPSSKIFVKTPWNLLHRELDKYHRAFESRVYDLTVFDNAEDTEGTVHRVMPRDVQRHPVKNKIYCVNYLRYYPGRPIKLPLVYINEEESPVLKRGGYIIPINRYLECVIQDGVLVPDHLEVECAGLQPRQVIRMDRIILPDGISPSRRVNLDTFMVGPVYGKGSDEPEDAAEGTEGATE